MNAPSPIIASYTAPVNTKRSFSGLSGPARGLPTPAPRGEGRVKLCCRGGCKSAHRSASLLTCAHFYFLRTTRGDLPMEMVERPLPLPHPHTIESISRPFTPGCWSLRSGSVEGVPHGEEDLVDVE